MSPAPPSDHDHDPAADDSLQEILAACLDHWEEVGPAALEAACARHPELAEALRQRIDALRGLGLLGATDGDEHLPEQIAGYRVVRVLGRGGMGVVFEAEQDEPRRRVAVKVLRSGLESPALRARFAHEATLLARLQHPGIAQIHAAGSATVGGEVLPYFAMELVDGQPVTDFARTHRLDARARLDLLTRICDAVQHAHQKGVIHRDLKPSNILVDATGQPKLVDFGVARATEGDVRATLQTRQGQLVGTLAYMSPEQASAEPETVDTRSDVYSLGVVAHELLAGALPYDVQGRRLVDALRAIAESQPVRLGSVDPALAGDVETIVLTALAKDKERRYASVEGLAADLRRYLRDEPIAARAPTAWYTLCKFARRNRTLVVAAIAVVLALALGLGGTLIGMLDARRAQGDAERRWQQAQAALEFQRRMLAAGQPFAEGRNARVADVIDRAARELDGAYPGQPEVEAGLRMTIGESYSALGLNAEAEQQLVRGEELLRSALGGGSPEALTAAAKLAMALTDAGQLARARAALERADSTAGEPTTVAAADARRALRRAEAKLLRAEGKFDHALTIQQDLFDDLRQRLGAGSEEGAEAGSALATTLRLVGRTADAVSLLQSLVSESIARHGERHPRTITMQLDFATALAANGRVRESRDLTDRLLPLAREVLGPRQPDTLAALSAAGFNHLNLGEFAQAEAVYRELLAAADQRFEPTSQLMVAAKNNLTGALVGQRKLDEAEAILRPLLAALIADRGPDQYETLAVQHSLATVLKDGKRYDEAVPLLQAVLASRRRTLGAEHESTLRSQRNLGLLYSDMGRLDEADELLADTAATAQRVLGASNFLPGDLLCAWGGILAKRERFEAAEKALREGHAWLERTLGADNAATRRAATQLGDLLRRLGKADEAAAWDERAQPRRASR